MTSITRKNKIQWENWNVKQETQAEENKKNSSGKLNMFELIVEPNEDNDMMPFGDFAGNSNVITPFGVFPSNSMLKPTDRWDCWMGYTNFCITNGMVNKLNRDIEGIAALSILDKYSFCIGISKQFEFAEVRKNIEDKLGIEYI